MRLIDADKLEKKLTGSLSAGYDTENNTDVTEAFHNGLKIALYELENAPTVEAEPVRHEKWVEDKFGYNACSKCHYEWDTPEYDEAKYCPQCGAKMDLEE